MSSLPQLPSLMQIIAATTRDVPKAPPAAKQDCSDVVHLAFFFDGTGNNRDADAAGQRWSNVARLFDASMNAPGKGIYSFYVSGVGTPFNGEASWVEPDVWFEDTVLGGAFGAEGDRRLSDGEDRMNQAVIGQKSFNDSSVKHSMWGTIDIEAPAYAEALKTHHDLVRRS